MKAETRTPWVRVFEKFGLSHRELARELGMKNASMITRRLSGEINRGVIRGDDIEKIMSAAKRLKVDIKPEDMQPVVK